MIKWVTRAQASLLSIVYKQAFAIFLSTYETKRHQLSTWGFSFKLATMYLTKHARRHTCTVSGLALWNLIGILPHLTIKLRQKQMCCIAFVFACYCSTLKKYFVRDQYLVNCPDVQYVNYSKTNLSQRVFYCYSNFKMFHVS